MSDMERTESAGFGTVVESIDERPGPPNPWANVALVTFNHPGTYRLAKKTTERIRFHVERAIRPHTSAPVIVCEEGSTIHLHGEGVQVAAPLGPKVVGLIVLTKDDRLDIDNAPGSQMPTAALFAILDRGLPGDGTSHG